MAKIDWEGKYLKGEMPLYDAMLAYMGEDRQIPPLIYQAFNNAILDYQYGLTDNLDIGLDVHFQKSKTKRFKESYGYSYNRALIREVEAFNKIGLSKVKASIAKAVDPKVLKDALDYLNNHPFMNRRPELENLNYAETAYSATGRLFNTSEATVRKKLEKC